MSGIIKKFTRFRNDLQGWAAVELKEFKQLDGLRSKKEWTADDKKTVASLIQRGGAYALHQMFKDSPAKIPAALVFVDQKIAVKTLAPDRMNKEELEKELASLIKSCIADGWTEARFAAYLQYLESDLEIGDLHEAAKGEIANSPAPQDAPDSKGAKEKRGVDEDIFADLFRASSIGFRSYVRERLLHARRPAISSEQRKTS